MTEHAQSAERPLTVLDLGCHDGFVGAWIKQQHAGPVELYGVELHPRGVEEASRRGYARVVQGNALDALALLPELVGQVDAVVAFELIEHVPDMGELLEVCEAMLAPAGRVYISTPDGCFGDGANPHHLRALRAQDLADLLRRRGDLVDMAVGADTITTAAYTPARKVGEAVIYCGRGWERWSPADVDEKGLGGSETAAVHVARELSRQGWVVTVYGEMESTCFEQVMYRHHSTFDPLAPVDLLISSRIPEVFARPTRARRRMLWLHDVDVGDRLTPAIADRIDDVLVLSDWHRLHVAGRYPFLGQRLGAGGRIVQARNGIDLERFTGEVGERRPRVLYTSSPDRGLDVLLELWPEIVQRVLAAGAAIQPELAACYSPVYDKIAGMDPVVGAFRARVHELADQPGVTLLPSQGQADLARLMRESLVWAAPSFNSLSGQPFHETSCIGAMEAQAAGLHVVASNWGALAQTVAVGARVDGPPMSNRWRRAFVKEIVRGLTDRTVQTYAQAEGPRFARRHLGWAPVAAQISTLAGVGRAAGSPAG